MNPHFDRALSTLSRRELIAIATTLATPGCIGTRSLHGRAKTAPIEYDEHGGLMIEARVARGELVRMILDTGASRSALDSAFVRKLGLPLRDGGEVEGSAGVVRAHETDIELEIAPIDTSAPADSSASSDRARLSCTVYDVGSYDPRCVGILGGDFLSRAPFQIFYRERKWSRGDAPSGERIPMRLDNGIPRIRVTIDGSPLELRIDTGAAFPPGPDAYLNVTVAQAQALGLTGPPHAVFTASGTGGETLKLDVHALDSLVIGERHLERAFAIVQPKVGYFARDDAVGFLGNSVLDKLDPGFDYAAAAFTIGA
jgi:predicted aspartyl protease